MWGTWFFLGAGLVVGAALLLGLAVLGSPIIALVIAAVGGLALLAGASLRRSSEYVDRDEPRSRHDPVDSMAAREAERGAPAAGTEGSEVLPPTPGAPTRTGS